MGNRIKAWEIILAGFAFTVLSMYVMAPVESRTPNQLTTESVHGKILQVPEAPSAPPSVTIKIEKLNKELEKLDQLDNLEQVEKEIKKVEKELEAASIELEKVSLPSLKRLPEILITSH